MTAGVSAVFPLLLNLMLTMTMFPVINYDWYQLPNYKALFMNLAVKNVIAYCIVYMALIFVFAGLIAGLALSLSLYANNRFVVLSLPFLICIVSGRLVAYSGNPVRACNTEGVLCSTEFANNISFFMHIVCCACFMRICAFYGKGRENGCFIMTDYRERKESRKLH